VSSVVKGTRERRPISRRDRQSHVSGDRNHFQQARSYAGAV